MPQVSTTLDLLKELWPIIIVLVGSIIWNANEATMNKQTRSDVKDFLKETYPEDRSSLATSIEKVREAQERAEARLEAKLDKISDQSSTQLEKVYNEINKTNILLAEMKGRMSNNPQVTDLTRI